jgi:hypothetical protein
MESWLRKGTASAVSPDDSGDERHLTTKKLKKEETA